MNRRSIPSLLLALALALTLCGCTHRSAPGAVSEEPPASSVAEEEPKPPQAEYIVYPAFTDRTFTEDDHILYLENSADNAVDFLFVISDADGSELFTSEPVAPGEHVGWDVTTRWHGRSHTIQITSTPVLPDGTQGNTSRQEIVITVAL